MSRYSPYNIPGASDIYHQTDRLDDLCSQSGSDEGSAYVEAMLGDMVKVDTDVDDDCSSGSLTSQTLNVDGTPKRPMNAFMIFARRRRPQVSSENQSMRTGEISKILSREWNAMPPLEKQFYLDQAKLLKDNFNSKYPDYVYRRRPNNSRKKRRPDSATPHASDSTPEAVDELRLDDPGESSHTDGEGSQGESSGELFPSGELPKPYNRLPTRHQSFSYPTPYQQQQPAHRDNFTFNSSASALPSRTHMSASPPNQNQYPYPQPFPQQRRATLLGSQPPRSWDSDVSSKLDQYRSAAAATSFQPNTRQTVVGKSSPPSTYATPGSWPPMSSSSSAFSPLNYTFQPSSSGSPPFYDAQHQGNHSPPSHHPDAPLSSQLSLGFDLNFQHDATNPVSQFETPSASSSSTVSMSGNDASMFVSPQPQRGSNVGFPRALIASVAQSQHTYPHAQPSLSPSTVPQISSYWGRDRIEG